MIQKYWRLINNCFLIRSKKYLLIRLIELLLGYPLLLISYCIPRDRKKWLFGTNVGFVDNAKYLFIYINEQHDEVDPIWITTKNEDIQVMRKLGFEAYQKYSLKGLIHSLTGYVYVFTYHSKDVNYFTSGRVKKVNLWHGVGIKGGDGGKKGNNFSSRENSTFLTKLVFPYLYEKFDLFLSTSDMMNAHFTTMFSLDKKCIYDTIYPRCYYMCKGKEFMLSFINKYEDKVMYKYVSDFSKYNRVFLYMPTWRGNLNDDFIQEAGFDFERLNGILKKKKNLFIFKLHPAVRVFNNIKPVSYSNILFLDKSIDIYPILPFTDVLITDYSSIYYDYILLDKGIILYPFDRDTFLETSNNLAFDYDEYTPGYRCMSITDLENALASDGEFKVHERKRIINNFWGRTNIADLNSFYKKIKSL
jgi:CDP-glycerol glycerophosphotransferase (TagB/SpsB family)